MHHWTNSEIDMRSHNIFLSTSSNLQITNTAGKFRHAFNAAFLTFICTSSASFYICFSEVNRKYSTIQKAFKDQNIKEVKKNDEG